MLKPFQFSMLLSDFEASNIKIKGSVIIEDYEWTCDVSSDPIQTKLITLQPSKPGRQSASFIAMYGGEHEEGYSHTQVSVIEGDEFWEF